MNVHRAIFNTTEWYTVRIVIICRNDVFCVLAVDTCTYMYIYDLITTMDTWKCEHDCTSNNCYISILEIVFEETKMLISPGFTANATQQKINQKTTENIPETVCSDERIVTQKSNLILCTIQ